MVAMEARPAMMWARRMIKMTELPPLLTE
jgi:hypothetical protein